MSPPFLLAFLLIAAQPPGQGSPLGIPLPPPVDPSTIAVRPGEAPPGGRPVQQSETAEPIGLAFAAFDTNLDGRTTREEAEAALLRTFAAVDSNRDGQLGYIEYSNWAQTWLGSQTALPGPYQIDSNGDDRISRDEFIEAFRRQFARADRDGDGAVTHAELLTVRNPVLPALPRPTEQRRRVRQ